MAQSSRITLKSKLTQFIMSITGLALLLFTIIVTFYFIHEARQRITEEMQSIAELIAKNTATALAQDDKDNAIGVLSSLNAISSVKNAAVLDREDQIFARYEAADSKKITIPVMQSSGHRFEGNHLYTFQSIDTNGQQLGSIYIATDLSLLHIKTLTNLFFLIFISLLSLLICYLFSSRLQALISRPILNLATAIDYIKDHHDLSIRVELDDYLEIKKLADGFNSMLKQLQENQRALRDSRDQLQNRVTERTQELAMAKEKAESDEQRLTLALEASGFALWEWYPKTNEAFIDETWNRILGYGSIEGGKKQQKWSDELSHIHPDDSEKVNTELSRHLSGKTAVFRSERRERTANGKWLWVLVIGKIVERDSHQRPTRMIGIMGSIDDIKKTQLQLDEARVAAERANQAKSRFLANMSHELRTPLNAIIGFTEVLQHDISLSPDQSEYIKIINMSGDHLLSLINNILDTAKIESDKISINAADIDLLDFLTATVTMLRVRADAKDLPIVCEFDSELPSYIRVDELKLRQVLINLIGNAIKFTKQGKIVLRVNKPVSGRLHFEIQDSGEGINSEELDQLFQPFSQTRSGQQSSEGTGLGLSISKRFIELMGGSIKVSSEPGKGSLFYFDLRYDTAENSQKKQMVTEKRVIGLAEGQNAYKIMIAEDIVFNSILIKNMMEKVGFSVLVVEDGQQAVDQFEEFQPDFIWMDIMMPVMDGMQATARIRQLNNGSSVKIVALTASVIDQDKDHILQSGFDDIVYKPVREPEIYACLEQQLQCEFIYQDSNNESAKAPSQSVPDINLLDDVTCHQLRQAAMVGNLDKLQALTQEIAIAHHEIAEYLDAMIGALEFELLLETIPDRTGLQAINDQL